MSPGLEFHWRLKMRCSSQIRPSDGGYGFSLEERNRVPIIRSVEKGSPAEVRNSTYTPFWSAVNTKLTLENGSTYRPTLNCSNVLFCCISVAFSQKTKSCKWGLLVYPLLTIRCCISIAGGETNNDWIQALEHIQTRRSNTLLKMTSWAHIAYQNKSSNDCRTCSSLSGWSSSMWL